MKKDGTDGKVRVDHEYTLHGSNKKAQVSSLRKIDKEIKEEPTGTANILFLCDICKDVFADLRQLKVGCLIYVMRKPVYAICEQQRHRSDCASTQSDQHHCVLCLDIIIPLIAIAEISRLQHVPLAE